MLKLFSSPASLLAPSYARRWVVNSNADWSLPIQSLVTVASGSGTGLLQSCASRWSTARNLLTAPPKPSFCLSKGQIGSRLRRLRNFIRREAGPKEPSRKLVSAMKGTRESHAPPPGLCSRIYSRFLAPRRGVTFSDTTLVKLVSRCGSEASAFDWFDREFDLASKPYARPIDRISVPRPKKIEYTPELTPENRRTKVFHDAPAQVVVDGDGDVVMGDY